MESFLRCTISARMEFLISLVFLLVKMIACAEDDMLETRLRYCYSDWLALQSWSEISMSNET